MIISESKKFVFLPVPGIATDIIANLFLNYGSLEFNYDFDESLGKITDKVHYFYEDLLKLPYAKQIQEFTTFTFVQNPYDRLYCNFISLLKRLNENEKKTSLTEKDFNKFIQRFINKNLVNTYSWQNIPFCAMHKFVSLDNEKIDFIGKIENLKDDLKCLSDQIEIDDNLDFDDSKIKAIHIDKYENKTIALVNKLYGDDFEYFEYHIYNPDEISIKSKQSSTFDINLNSKSTDDL